MVLVYNNEWSLQGVVEEHSKDDNRWATTQRWSVSGDIMDTTDVWNEFYTTCLYPLESDGSRYGINVSVEVRPIEGEYKDGDGRKGPAEFSLSGYPYENEQGAVELSKGPAGPRYNLNDRWNNLMMAALFGASRTGEVVNVVIKVKVDLQDENGNSVDEYYK